MVTNDNGSSSCIIKRSGVIEPFHMTKLHTSIVRACLAVAVLEGEAQSIAEHVTQHVADWIEDKAEVTFRDIHERAHQALVPRHTQAAYAYDVHDQVL